MLNNDTWSLIKYHRKEFVSKLERIRNIAGVFIESIDKDQDSYESSEENSNRKRHRKKETHPKLQTTLQSSNLSHVIRKYQDTHQKLDLRKTGYPSVRNRNLESSHTT